MTIQFTVPDMACSACSDTITKALKSLDPNATVAADLKTKQVMVETQQSETAVKEAVTAAGYTVAA
jgi:copper chaperone